MGTFRFKHFEVQNEHSAMKVNTDGVLLGAASTLKPEDRAILDIGTGTGTIALMLAQRLDLISTDNNYRITGIDIDPPSAAEAAENFRNSPWNEHLQCLGTALQDFTPSTRFDLIASNPPYFQCDLPAPEARRNNARHGDTSLKFQEILDFAGDFLSDDGRLAIILPTDQKKNFLEEAGNRRLFPSRILDIRSTSTKPETRTIFEMSRTRTNYSEEKLTMTEKGRNTEKYISLVKDFYLNIG